MKVYAICNEDGKIEDNDGLMIYADRFGAEKIIEECPDEGFKIIEFLIFDPSRYDSKAFLNIEFKQEN